MDWIVVVALGDVWALHPDFTYSIFVRIGYLHLNQGEYHAHRVHFEVTDRIECQDWTCLGETIALNEIKAKLLILFENLWS